MTKSAILVDEMNVIGQLHRIGIEGIQPWSAFYKGIQDLIGFPTENHFYCSNVPEHMNTRFQRRGRFFHALKRDGIEVHEGFSVLDSQEKLVEKGVDVMLGMDISLFALDGVKDIIVCSGDSDLVPAIERAKFYGSRIHVVVSKNIPAAHIIDAADVIIRLEDVLKYIPSHSIVKSSIRKQNFIKEGA
ncbi:MAG: NYN domain-containing protein [Psychrobacillus sp.]